MDTLVRCCSLPGCHKKHDARGLCGMHYARWKRYGDPTFVKPKQQSGSAHYKWSGAAASYNAVHLRLHKCRGRARDHQCAHCQQRAGHWAYDHNDPDERLDSEGHAYSTSLDRYIPLCVACHWRFDHGDS